MFPHSTMLGPLFWIIMGFLYTIFMISIKYWAEDLKFNLNWWKWTILSVWFILLNIVIAGAFTLIGENEARAGLYFLGVFGTTIIVLSVGLWRLLKK